MTKKKTDTQPDKQQGWLNRAQLADRWNCSVGKIRNMENDKLHPVKDKSGTYRFDPAEVEAVEKAMKPTKPKANGVLAAQIFKMFRDGHDLTDIVIELEVDPELVRTLYREYREADLEAAEQRRAAHEAQATFERDEQQKWKEHYESLERQDRALQEHLLEMKKLEVEGIAAERKKLDEAHARMMKLLKKGI